MTKIEESLKRYIYELKQQLAITKIALELLKNKENYFIFVNENAETIDVNYAIVKAKEMMKSDLE